MMKLRTIFLYVWIIWIIDFFSTIIALNFFNNFHETSNIPAFFFALGFHGWFFMFLLATFALFLLSIGIYFMSEFVTKKSNDGIGFFVGYVCVGLYVVLQIFVILHNVELMIRML